ncbi:MAG: Hpt domain-containing protein [Hungatella hathewayi]|nr:Hpt domain-containing protein [Hungatella hathewayi]
MTLKEAYEKLGGDYADTTCRIGEDMLLRLIGILLKDSNYTDICMSLKQQDYETAFRAAHTLKGVTLNLGLSLLAEKTAKLTETLRSAQNADDIQLAFTDFDNAYRDMDTVFSELLDSSAPGGVEQ